MGITRFQDTNTRCIEWRPSRLVETQDVDEDRLIEPHSRGSTWAVAIEHASVRADITRFPYEQVAA